MGVLFVFREPALLHGRFCYLPNISRAPCSPSSRGPQRGPALLQRGPPTIIARVEPLALSPTSSSLLLLAAPAHLFFLLPPVLSPFFSTVVLPGPLPCAEDSPPSCIVRFLSTSFLSGKQPPSAAAAPERKLVKRNLMMHDGGVPSAQILPGSHSARAVEVPLRG